MSTIELTEKELYIRKLSIKATSESKTLYYSNLVKEEETSPVRSVKTILEKINRYDFENISSILASIVVPKSTSLLDALNIDAH